jgi:hypothetical protein
VLKRYPTASACLLLVGLTWAIYWQVAGFEFVAFDDDSLVYRHPVIREGLSRESLAWAFTSIVWANWTPLAWLSHMLDVEMFGLDPGGHGAAPSWRPCARCIPCTSSPWRGSRSGATC